MQASPLRMTLYLLHQSVLPGALAHSVLLKLGTMAFQGIGVCCSLFLEGPLPAALLQPSSLKCLSGSYQFTMVNPTPLSAQLLRFRLFS